MAHLVVRVTIAIDRYLIVGIVTLCIHVPIPVHVIKTVNDISALPLKTADSSYFEFSVYL